MATLENYFVELQQREGLKPIGLISNWVESEIESCIFFIREAVRTSRIIGFQIPNFTGTNQSKGNKAAEYFFEAVQEYFLHQKRLRVAKGAGYPDKLLSIENVSYCFELKATSNWKDTDSNRRVLTSSSRKLRSLIENGDLPENPRHLICTVFYDDQTAIVGGIRLDFLESNTEINIRLEASTSQKLLSKGEQRTEFIV
jgi:hypothetical protein